MKAEPTTVSGIEDDPGNQKARDHEKHVDADEAAGNDAGERMKRDDEKNGDAPQAINIAAVSQWRRGLARGQRVSGGLRVVTAITVPPDQ